MALTKRQRSTNEVDSSSQAPPQPQRASRTTRARGNIPHPLDLTHLDNVARYNCLNERMVMATRYYDEDLLAQVKMLDDIRWLFLRCGMVTLFRIQKAYR